MDHFWLTDEQFAKIAPHLPTDTRGKERVDDQRVISGIVQVLKSGGRWADAPREVYGPKKTLYNRFVRWAAKGRLGRTVRDTRTDWRPTGASADRLLGREGAPLRFRRQRGNKTKPLAARAVGARPRSTRSPIGSDARSSSC